MKKQATDGEGTIFSIHISDKAIMLSTSQQ